MNTVRKFLIITMLWIAFAAPDANAQPGPGPGGGGGGPGDPPRATPGLDPVTLSGLASAGYIGYRFLKRPKIK